jgi:hypothetical protein
MLRRRSGAVAVPSPFRDRELLVLSSSPKTPKKLRAGDLDAELHEIAGDVELSLEDPQGRRGISNLLERAMVVAFEGMNDHWNLSSSTRIWYQEEPIATREGLEIIRRTSFATVELGEQGVGVVFDPGYLYRTAETVADFFGPKGSHSERRERRRRFDQLRNRGERRKGTLLYDTGKSTISVCYFDHFANGVTCANTGPILHTGSLHEYCNKKYPRLGIEPDDLVAYVSFRGIPHPVPVPARCLRLRVMADKEQSFNGLKDFKNHSPADRLAAIGAAWDLCQAEVSGMMGLKFSEGLWSPEDSAHELLPCPRLTFGRGRSVLPPENPSEREYKTYYQERLEKLRGGGLYRFEEAVGRKLHIVTPSSWSDDLQKRFVDDLTNAVRGLSGIALKVTPVREDDVERIVSRLQSGEPGTAVIVFDDRLNDSAGYFLLSHGLSSWRIKRLTKRTVEQKWRSMERARNLFDQAKAARRWRDMIELSTIDTLDQMEAIPWRLEDFEYDAALAIDVSEGRRYFGMSLLVCRDEQHFPSFMRVTDVWPKGDHQHETINPTILRDKIVHLFSKLPDADFAPLRSILILRDGHQCGDEPKGIQEAVERLKKNNVLAQDATVDVVDVRKKSVKNLRMWYRTSQRHANVLEGHCVYLDETSALVSCTGAATLGSHVTAEPSILSVREGTDIRKAARAYFALAQLNYSSPNKAHRLAQPLRESDIRLRQRTAQDMRGIR